MKLSRTSVDAARETRLWITTIIVPIGLLTYSYMIKHPDKWEKIKSSVKKTFKKEK